MLTEPKIVEKAAQPYAAILLTLRQPEIAQQAPPLIDDVIAWVKGKGGKLTGAPFFNYVNFYPGGTMDMQVGMPTDRALPGDGRFTTGTLPGGRFASITATVPYHELHDANMTLDEWTKAQGIALDGSVDGDRFVGANRMEIYHKDPGEDPSGHPVTELAFRLKD
ncbi:MAG: GyrI-like domain-containing protein [Devosia sp.]|jgi:effector-binding domain-containing protein